MNSSASFHPLAKYAPPLIAFLLTVAALGFLLPAPAGADCSLVRQPRIVGGQTTAPDAYLHQVSLQLAAGVYTGRHFCGGTLVARDWVLTAAHCLAGDEPSDLTVVIGRHDLTSGKGQAIAPDALLLHSGYNADTFDHDFALIHLSEPADAAYPTLPIPAQGDPRGLGEAGGVGTAIGWGDTVWGGSSPYKLREVELPIVDPEETLLPTKTREEAERQVVVFHDFNDLPPITENMLVAGPLTGGKGVCQGDSGGPLLVSDGATNVVVGISSWGVFCAQQEMPSIFSRTSAQAAWIEASMAAAPGRTAFYLPHLPDSQSGYEAALILDNLLEREVGYALTLYTDGEILATGTGQVGARESRSISLAELASQAGADPDQAQCGLLLLDAEDAPGCPARLVLLHEGAGGAETAAALPLPAARTSPGATDAAPAILLPFSDQLLAQAGQNARTGFALMNASSFADMVSLSAVTDSGLHLGPTVSLVAKARLVGFVDEYFPNLAGRVTAIQARGRFLAGYGLTVSEPDGTGQTDHAGGSSALLLSSGQVLDLDDAD